MTGKKILEFRLKKKLTRQEFANIINYSVSYLKDIESEKVKPSRNFLESIKKYFYISIDSLLSGSFIMETIDANRSTENPRIIFLYAFTQEKLFSTEKHLIGLMKNRRLIMIDATSMTSGKQLYTEILDKDKFTSELPRELGNLLNDNEIMLVIKNMSLSKIPKKDKGSHIRDIFKSMDDAWYSTKEGNEIILKHKEPKSALILLDFPSFLEKYYNDIGYYTIPIFAHV